MGKGPKAGSESLLKMEHRSQEASAGKLGGALAQGPCAEGHGDRLQSVSQHRAALEAQPLPSRGEQAEGSELAAVACPTVSSSERLSCRQSRGPSSLEYCRSPCGRRAGCVQAQGRPSPPQSQSLSCKPTAAAEQARWPEVTLATRSPGTTGSADQFGSLSTRFSLRRQL